MLKPAWTLLCWCAISTTFVASETPVCRDETGKAVDWFVTFKLPRLENSVNPLVQAGLAHATFTSETSAAGFVLSEKSISDPTSAPGRTLEPLYNSSDILRLLYNDQKPNSSSASESHGHTKGVVLASPSGGLWLVHSVPHFPLASNASHYEFPSTAHHYGQSMLCITLPPGQFNSLGEQLGYNYPLVYDWASPSELISTWPNLAAVAQEEHVRNPPYFSQSTLTSVGGQAFQVFAKTAKFGKDLYADWVATSLQANLLVESWPHGSGGRLPSECQLQYKVENVLEVSVDDIEWKDGLDHSKWAVQKSNTTTSHWLCIGDINRMDSQEKRGGGTVCLNSVNAWRNVRAAVLKSEACGPQQQSHHIVTNP